MMTAAHTVSMNAHGSIQKMGEGNKTQVVYTLIKEGKYAEVVRILANELQSHPRSRAALSLLGYSYYQMQNFAEAANYYRTLSRHHPETQEYKVYLAQSLYKAGDFEEASKVALAIEDPQYAYRMLHLQAAIKYEQDDLAGTKSFAEQCIQEDPDSVVIRAAIMYKEGDFEGACALFQEAQNSLGYHAPLAYNIALCHYKLNQYGNSLKNIAEIIERGVREHPELSVGSNSNDVQVRSVGNSQTLKDTALVEAFNLKSAIEYQLKNFDAAKEALSDMPPRNEEELDPVTLHNQALVHMDADASSGFKKLGFLIQQPMFPPETFGNLLLLYIKHMYYDRAADVLAENAHLHESCLNPELLAYIEATVMTQNSPEEAYRKFDQLSNQHIERLRKKTKQIQDARLQDMDKELIKQALKEFDEELERYIPVLMAQAKIYWDIENYSMVETIFKESAEFCCEHDVWKLNVAHVFFMQETKFRDAIRYYEPVVKRQEDNILDVTAIVLANLCVSYIMTSRNEDAENLMKQIETEEERQSYANPEKNSYHLCIVNLVIGTLYCAKLNYEFGISRIIKSLEPYNEKIGPDTWYYAKRCFLALIETLAKHMMVLKDEFAEEVLGFFEAAEEHGKDIITKIQEQGQVVDPAIHNVSFEARILKNVFLKLRD